MRTALLALNKLVDDGLIPAYAIGGAIAANFYVEAFATADLDVFVLFPAQDASAILPLSPIYRALERAGGKVRGEHIEIDGTLLQIVPDSDALSREAITQATLVDYEGVPTRVMAAEHLCAIALQTGRRKDLARVEMFVTQQAVDLKGLVDILERHGLSEKLPEEFRPASPFSSGG